MSKENTNSDNHRGYIQNLSPIKRSRNQNQWYDFDLQTSPSKLRRVVGFNIANHSMLQEHEVSKTAVTLKNTKQNSNNDIIFNQQSTLRVTPTFDIDFDYKPINKSQKTEPSTQPAKKITLEELPTLQVNQKVNVTASISLGNENPKPVQLKSSSEMTTVMMKLELLLFIYGIHFSRTSKLAPHMSLKTLL